jgi:hypothetical protein
MANKLGNYISKLMTTVLDFKEDDFVRDLAIQELNRLKVNIEEFVETNKIPNKSEVEEKQLLQEDNKNVKDK